MQLPSFKDWLAQQESSAFTRRRRDALLGLAPEIPDASIHSRSTFPFEKELRDKKKKKKKKRKKKDEDKKDKKDDDLVEEGKRVKPVLNRQVDDWLKEIEGLRPDLEALKSVIDKKRKEKPKKGGSETETDVKDDNGRNDNSERSDRKSDDPDFENEESENEEEFEDS